MGSTPLAAATPWTAGARWAASVVAAVHMAIVGHHVFGNRSAWAASGAPPSRNPPPPFVHLPFARAAEKYLEVLRVDKNGRFPGIFAGGAEARLEIRGPDGTVRARLPDPEAWWPVRQRQQALATALLTDVPVQPWAAGERSFPAGAIPTRQVWRIEADGQPAKLLSLPEQELSRDPGRRDLGPSPWQQAVARSYARRLGGADAEVRRIWSTQIPLSTLMAPAAKPDAAAAELGAAVAEHAADYGKAANDQP